MSVVGGVPVVSVSRGVPTTLTTLLNVTVIGITAPTPYVPLVAVEDTPVTVGRTPSITMFLLAFSDPAAPGGTCDARVRVALFAFVVTTSLMVAPPGSVNDPVPT